MNYAPNTIFKIKNLRNIILLPQILSFYFSVTANFYAYVYFPVLSLSVSS